MVEIGDVRVGCDVAGSGRPLLLMHGAEGSRRMFDALVPHLSAHFTTITYDQRDCGETVNPPHPATLAELADDAAGLLRALGHPSAFVYGTSFGGRVAQMLGLLHPDLVERLVLGSTWPLPVALGDVNAENVARILELRAGLPQTAEALAGYFLPDAFLAQHPSSKAMFAGMSPRDERTRRRAGVTAESPALSPAGLAMPALLLAGEVDRVVPHAVTLGMAASMPHATTMLLAGLGHAGALQAPARVAAAIRAFCFTAVPPATMNEESP